MTKDFRVTIELCTTEELCRPRQRSSVAHDRGALSPMIEPGAHDRHACVTRMRARQGMLA